MKRSLIPDTKTIEHTTFSLGFDIEVSDCFCGYVRVLHLDITIRTTGFLH